MVGKKGRDNLRKRGFKFVGEYLDVSAHVDFSKAKEIAKQIAELYIKEEVDAVYAIYNEFKNVMVQNLRAEKLLPDRSGSSQRRSGRREENRRRACRRGWLAADRTRTERRSVW